MEIQTDVLSILRICLCKETCKRHTTLRELVNDNPALKVRVVIYYEDKDGIYKKMDIEEKASKNLDKPDVGGELQLNDTK